MDDARQRRINDLVHDALREMTQQGTASTWYTAGRVLGYLEDVVRPRLIDGTLKTEIALMDKVPVIARLEGLIAQGSATAIYVERGSKKHSAEKAYRALGIN